MAYSKTQAARQPRKSSTHGLILAVGGRAFVNMRPSPAPALQAEFVPLIDDRGNPIDNDLEDGQEVEIVAWRPKTRQGLAYLIRRLSDGREWWSAARVA